MLYLVEIVDQVVPPLEIKRGKKTRHSFPIFFSGLCKLQLLLVRLPLSVPTLKQTKYPLRVGSLCEAGEGVGAFGTSFMCMVIFE